MPANTLIAIKRSQSTATPVSLANGELAYSFSSDKLFIGQTANSSVATSVEYIGGKLAMDKIANLESVAFGGGVTTHANVTISDTMTLSSATNNAVLFAKTGGIVDFVTGTTGKLLQIAANGTPTFDDLNGGTY
jgi:L-alanine-DL-glutamate epimerase-like enolase superfamily enzyme